MKILILNSRGQVLFATLILLAIFLGLGVFIETSPIVDFFRGQALYDAKDYTQAMKWFQKASEKRNPYAEFYIGVEYELGQGVSQDYPEAKNWYKKSLVDGCKEAQKRIDILKGKMGGAK